MTEHKEFLVIFTGNGRATWMAPDNCIRHQGLTAAKRCLTAKRRISSQWHLFVLSVDGRLDAISVARNFEANMERMAS